MLHISSRQNPLHLSSCYGSGYRFWGKPIAFQGFVEISIFEIHLSKVMEMALWLGPGTECNKWLSLWHCSKEICHKNDWVRERERGREWVGCQMIWTDMDCRKQGTTGWISPIGFACSVYGPRLSLLGALSPAQSRHLCTSEASSQLHLRAKKGALNGKIIGKS